MAIGIGVGMAIGGGSPGGRTAAKQEHYVESNSHKRWRNHPMDDICASQGFQLCPKNDGRALATVLAQLPGATV